MEPFAHLQSLDIDQLDGMDLEDLRQPWDDNPEVSGTEVDTAKGLAADLGHFRIASSRTIEDLRARPEAVRHLPRLPDAGESYHAVISGKYALWDLVPAILERIQPQTIEALDMATLSFSKPNAAEILTLLDAGKIKSIGLLVSHYFKGTSRHIYDSLIPQLLERGHHVQAMRTHAKIILIRTSEGTKYTVESSANLRSCKNVEQFVLTNDPDLYDFHHRWIVDELLTGDGSGKVVRGKNEPKEKE